MGYGLGCLIGIGLTVAIALVPALRSAILPLATAINSVPVVGYSPLILLWFGIGVSSKIVMVAMAVSFTILLSMLAGLDRVDRRAVDLMPGPPRLSAQPVPSPRLASTSRHSTGQNASPAGVESHPRPR